MAVCEIWDVRGRLDHPIDYAVNPEKTKNMTAKSKYTSEELYSDRKSTRRTPVTHQSRMPSSA